MVEKIVFSTKNREKSLCYVFKWVLAELPRGSKFSTFGGVRPCTFSRLGSKTRFFEFSMHLARFISKKCVGGRNPSKFFKNWKIQKISEILTYSSLANSYWLRSYELLKMAQKRRKSSKITKSVSFQTPTSVITPKFCESKFFTQLLCCAENMQSRFAGEILETLIWPKI